MARLLRLTLILWLALGVLSASVSVLQAQSDAVPAPAAEPMDYATWDIVASGIENLIADRAVSDMVLEQARVTLSDYRARFLSAQDVNGARIATVRQQIEALGPVPENGAVEAPEIATRRGELSEQLATLQAPGIAAQEAFRRADGLIRQIDIILRERQADALLTLWPSPLNPGNWLAGINAVYSSGLTLIGETLIAIGNPTRVQELRSNLPIVAMLLLFSGFMLLRGRVWLEIWVNKLQSESASRRGKQALALVTSLVQVIVPIAAIFALTLALNASAILGPTGQALNEALLNAGFAYFSARWIGRQIFPMADTAYSPFNLPTDRRREGRVMANLAGLFLGLDLLVRAFVDPEVQSPTANAVVLFPLLVLAGVVLFRMGQLMLGHARLTQASDGDEARFFDGLLGLVGRAAMFVGFAAPLLAAIGYVQAAEALLFPAIRSLGLLAVLVLLQSLVSDLYALMTRRLPDQAEGLVPALIGLALTAVSLPLLALIWGVRTTELLEYWQYFRTGFRIGETRIAPANILTFLIVFSVGYALTRLVQGGLGASVLPKTKIDKGGQKAIISGTGYVGIFFAGLVAISTAGIDLSGLAIVAGALSVGIGFGLQNIVSNFISGLILLIERPVAEGDWIEVGTTMGTVRSISVRSTVIETFDRTDVIVPNADLISGTVTNWTRYNNMGRLIVKVGVAYGTDTRKVERILSEIGEAQPLAVLNPRPKALFMGFGDDALDFELRIVLSDVSFMLDVRSEVNHQIALRFAEEGIEIPFAQRDIWLRNPEALYPGAASTPKPEPESREPAPDRVMTADEIETQDMGDGAEPDSR